MDLQSIEQYCPEFKELLGRMEQLFLEKDADYADGVPLANFRDLEEDLDVPDHIGVMVRNRDKFRRIMNLLKREWRAGDGPMVKDESVEQTMIDAANYLLVTIILRRDWLTEHRGSSVTRSPLDPPERTPPFLNREQPWERCALPDEDPRRV